ncbi:arginine deiminase [Georgenia muralis]
MATTDTTTADPRPLPAEPPFVGSEVGRLREVIVHRPGLELLRLTPENMAELLFDDLLWVRRAQEEHDVFAEVLAGSGVKVLELTDLLRETLAVPQARTWIVEQTFDDRVQGPVAAPVLRDLAAAMGDEELAELLVGGLTRRELRERTDEPSSLVLHGSGADSLVLAPLPNHLFTRDTSCWVYDGVAVNAMRMAARARETVNYEAIYRWHPRFAPTTFHHWSAGIAGEASVEGGDVLVLGDGAVLVGMSERTTAQGVERLATRLFDAGVADRIVAVELPRARSFMHLDTVMTMVDERSFIKYAGLGMLPSYTVTPGPGPGGLNITDHEPERMHDALADAMGVTGLRILAAEQDVHAAAREQWDDGCNSLALAPGVVVTYDRNVTSNSYLRESGIEVLEVPGSELGRGRGGPRCMSCPTIREGL